MLATWISLMEGLWVKPAVSEEQSNVHHRIGPYQQLTKGQRERETKSVYTVTRFGKTFPLLFKFEKSLANF